MKLPKSTGPIFPQRELLKGIACGVRAWGSLGQAGVCRAADAAVEGGVGVPQKYCGSLSSAGRQAAAVPGCLQRDWLMQQQQRALKLAAWNCCLADGSLPMESEPASLCWGGGGRSLSSVAVTFSPQSCGRREGCAGKEWGCFLLVLKKFFASVLGAARILALIIKPAGPSEHSENIAYRYRANTRQ